jgi:hypothetical protein
MRYFAILFLILGNQIRAQAPASLEAETKRLYTAFHDIDIDALTQMLCIKAGDAYGKLDAYFLNDSNKFRYVFTNAKYNYGQAKTIEGMTYVPVSFRNVVRITYYKPLANVLDKQNELKALFDAQTIAYEKARNSFLISYPAKMIAYGTGGSAWKFYILDATVPTSLTASCLDEAILKELGFR